MQLPKIIEQPDKIIIEVTKEFLLTNSFVVNSAPQGNADFKMNINSDCQVERNYNPQGESTLDVLKNIKKNNQVNEQADRHHDLWNEILNDL